LKLALTIGGFMKKQNQKSEVRKTLDERDALYGGFENVAETSQILKDVAREHDNYGHLNAVHREALEMINHKIARIINGDPNYKDNWIDIAGYATLVADTLG
jgi:hypothetical protein